MTGGDLVRSAVTMTWLIKRESVKHQSNTLGQTYRNSHQLFDILDLMTRRGAEPLELRLHFRNRVKPLFRSFFGFFGLVLAAQDNLVVFSLILVEQGTLIVDGARGDLHLESVLLCVLLHFL